jgi:hypothetical protein
MTYFWFRRHLVGPTGFVKSNKRISENHGLERVLPGHF